MLLTGCPLEAVSDDVWSALELAGLARKGHLPVAGGTLDQTQSFLAAARRIWTEEDRWRADLLAVDD